DTEAEIKFMEEWAKEFGVEFSLTQVWAKGGEGAVDLAEKLVKLVEGNDKEMKLLYEDSLSTEEKINTIAKEIYGAAKVNFTDEAREVLEKIDSLGYRDYPVCMAKTPASLTRSEEHTSELQSRFDLVCLLLLEKNN